MALILEPSKFTLLSNPVQSDPVLEPYKFTLLSNMLTFLINNSIVLEPYKFTLLSNHDPTADPQGLVSFGTL